MPDPADDARRDEMLEAGGLDVTEATLRHRLAVVSDLAHSHAADAVSAATECEALRWQIAEDAQAAALRVQLDAVTAELDRLRAIPELRAGQRLRHIKNSILREEPDTHPRNSADEESESHATESPKSTNATSAGLSHNPMLIPAAVVTVRNRGEALVDVLSRLKDLGVEDIVVVDNASSDPAVGDALAVHDCIVNRVEVDLGDDAPWASGVMARLLSIGNVLDVAGLALPGQDCPDDVLDRMTDELRRRPDVDAVELHQHPTGEGGFRLLRRGLESRPEHVSVLDDPYVATATRSDPAGPSEAYARLHDDTLRHDTLRHGTLRHDTAANG